MLANINGVKLFFDIEGLQYLPDGPIMRERPVCFALHGGPGGDHSHFMPAFSYLTKAAQIVYIDHRGCGRSGPAPIETCSLAQNTDDIEALRQYLGLGKIYVIGHSYGGMVAQKYMLEYQENLYGAILIATAPSHRTFDSLPGELERRASPEQKAFAEELIAGKLNGPDDFKKYMKLMGNLYNYKYDPAEANDGYERGIFNIDIQGYQFKNELSTFDFVPQLKEVTCPVQLFAGIEDFITPPAQTEEIAAAIKHAETHIMQESSHSVYTDRPETLDMMIDFIQRNFV